MRKFLTREIIEKCNVLKSSVYRSEKTPFEERQTVREKSHAGGSLSKLRQQGVNIIGSLNAYASMTGRIRERTRYQLFIVCVVSLRETENVFKLVTQGHTCVTVNTRNTIFTKENIIVSMFGGIIFVVCNFTTE